MRVLGTELRMAGLAESTFFVVVVVVVVFVLFSWDFSRQGFSV
jgi:preprotein translocase subunit SecF